MCAKAGMVSVGTVAVDGTRIAANASKAQTVDYEKLARKILEEAAEIDAAEDELYGDKRGDELPEQLRPVGAARNGCARRNASSRRSGPRTQAGAARAPAEVEGSKAPVGGGAMGRAARERGL